MAYDTNDTVRVSVVFSVGGVNTDPTTITLKVRDPQYAQTTYVYGADTTIVRDGAGLYHADLAPTVAGLWIYRWEGAGTVKAASENSFSVNWTAF